MLAYLQLGKTGPEIHFHKPGILANGQFWGGLDIFCMTDTGGMRDAFASPKFLAPSGAPLIKMHHPMPFKSAFTPGCGSPMKATPQARTWNRIMVTLIKQLQHVFRSTRANRAHPYPSPSHGPPSIQPGCHP